MGLNVFILWPWILQLKIYDCLKSMMEEWEGTQNWRTSHHPSPSFSLNVINNSQGLSLLNVSWILPLNLPWFISPSCLPVITSMNSWAVFLQLFSAKPFSVAQQRTLSNWKFDHAAPWFKKKSLVPQIKPKHLVSPSHNPVTSTASTLNSMLQP